MSYKDISIQLGFTERQIRSKINGIGLSKLRSFNKSYFKNITKPNQSYWLGFIYADGYIVFRPNSRTYELGIELKNTDVKLLKKLNYELGNVHTIYEKHRFKNFNGYDYETDSVILRVYSKEVVNDLINHGIVPNKTNQNTFPKCESYFWDFLRGFMDGDGCIYINPKGRISVKFVNSNEGFLKYLNDTIYDLIKIHGSIYKENDKKYQLVFFRQSDVNVLLDKIYYNLNNCKLERKYDIYKSYYGSPA